MKLIAGIALIVGGAAALVHGSPFTSWFSGDNKLPTRDDLGCTFTISSSGSFVCPAGRLPDGQIRINGSESTATFSIDANGGITDSQGFGCIVTDAPVTQIQCDQGKSPAKGFSIDSSNNLLFEGSPTFFACPATDTEYNVYVNPHFGQDKCFAITLKASGCGARVSSCAQPSPSTIWQTQTATENITQTVTIVTTSTETCISSVSSSLWSSKTTAICPHCTESKSASAINTPIPTVQTESWKRNYPAAFGALVDKRGVSEPSLHRLSKRAVYDDWNNVRLNDPARWVPVGQVKEFDLAPGTSQNFATANFHGCTILMVVSSDKVIFGHIRENMGGKCPLDTPQLTDDVLIPEIDTQLDIIEKPCESYVILLGSTRESPTTGVATLKQFFKDQEIPAGNIKYTFYGTGNQGLDDNVNTPIGKAVVQWNSPGQGQDSILSVWANTDDAPRLRLTYDSSGNLKEARFATSSQTTSG